MKRFLTWYVSGTLEPETAVGETYVLTKDYAAKNVWLHVAGEPIRSRHDANSTQLLIDINDDGTSIFRLQPELTEYATSTLEEDIFTDAILESESKITLDIDQVGSLQQGERLTVQLELEEIE